MCVYVFNIYTNLFACDMGESCLYIVLVVVLLVLDLGCVYEGYLGTSSDEPAVGNTCIYIHTSPSKWYSLLTVFSS